jgi:stage V sporulation protein G
METNTLEVQVQRMYRFETDRPLKAFADIIVNNALLIKGIMVMDGKNGLFVSMPKEQAKDKKWYEKVKCLSRDVEERISEVVLSAYKEK